MNSSESSTLEDMFDRVVDSVNAARAHYQIWYSLGVEDQAISQFPDVLDDYRFLSFFDAIRAGNYKLMYVELGCLFDTDTRAASIRNLKQKLKEKGFVGKADEIELALGGYSTLVSSALTIRSKLIAHKEQGATSTEVHKENGVIPDEVGKLIDACSSTLNSLNDDLFGGKRNWAVSAK